MSLPTVAVWEHLTGSTWGKVGSPAYTTLSCEPRHLDAGTWSLEMPFNEQAAVISRSRLITIDWRGVRIMTGRVGVYNPSTDATTHQPLLTVSGSDTYSLLGRCLAWPSPTLAITAQPESTLTTGPAETVIKTLVAANLRDRLGVGISVPATSGRGTTIRARARFQTLSALLTKKAGLGGLGISVGLVNTSSTRATLTLTVYEPVDKSVRVRLSTKVGTLGNWSQSETEPTATQTIVGGAGAGVDRVFRQRSTTASLAAATAWGFPAETFVDGPESFDNTELDEAGDEALAQGASTINLDLEAAEADGLLAFTHYAPGDQATAELVTGLEVVDVISAIGVIVDDDKGVTVTPKFGNPDEADPTLGMAQIIRALRQQVRALETRK